MIELKHCPFCGGEAEFTTIDEEDNPNISGGEYARCKSCAVSTKLFFPLMDSVDELIAEAWNMRVPIK